MVLTEIQRLQFSGGNPWVRCVCCSSLFGTECVAACNIAPHSSFFTRNISRIYVAAHFLWLACLNNGKKLRVRRAQGTLFYTPVAGVTKTLFVCDATTTTTLAPRLCTKMPFWQYIQNLFLCTMGVNRGIIKKSRAKYFQSAEQWQGSARSVVIFCCTSFLKKKVWRAHAFFVWVAPRCMRAIFTALKYGQHMWAVG